MRMEIAIFGYPKRGDVLNRGLRRHCFLPTLLARDSDHLESGTTHKNSLSMHVVIIFALVGWAMGVDQSECSKKCQGHVNTPSLAFGLLGTRPQIWLFGDSITVQQQSE